MNDVIKFSDEKRRELFSETGARKGMTSAIAEKDFWVCWVLRQLFTHPKLSSKILFKGGTSLSKVFNLIERFSEDVDLILDWRFVAQENPQEKRSNTKQDKLNHSMIVKAQEYIKLNVLNWVKESLGKVCQAEIDTDDESVINIQYPGVFEDQYLRPEIRLEIGPLAGWIPHGEYVISPYAAEVFPDVFSNALCKVKAIKAERTFWEKVTIIHREAFRREDNVQPSRYSRHYYDLARMCHSSVKREALNSIDLLKRVVAFKQKFYSSAWARYDLAKPGSIKLIPADYVIKILRQDYQSMKNMIFGDYPEFNDILTSIKSLEDEINSLDCEK